MSDLKFAKPLIPLDLNNVKYIILHSIDAVAATPEQIHEWHLKNGWSGFGYNEYIRKDGSVFIGRGDNIGAQCQGYNSKSYGIACEGDYDTETEMPKEQLKSLIARIKYNKARFKNLVEIVPHSKLFATSCPAKYFPLNVVLGSINVITLPDAIKILQEHGIINSPQYWEDVASNKVQANGDYVASLIQNIARFIK